MLSCTAGIDVGNDFMIIACARNNGIDVLQNETGQRKTRVGVTYNKEHRFIGDDFYTQLLSNVDNSVLFAKRLLGKMYSDVTEEEKTFFAAEVVADSTGRAVFKVKHLGKEHLLYPEEVIATVLRKAKDVYRLNNPNVNIDAERCPWVLPVPAHFTDNQRRAMADAANLAGIEPRALSNEIAAIATQYFRSRTIDAERHVVFYDMGTTSTNVYLVKFSPSKDKNIEVIDARSNHNLGGRNFDELIVGKVAELCKSKHNKDLYAFKKSLFKARNAAEKVKQKLSASVQENFLVEYLFPDIDVSLTFKREDFVALIDATYKQAILQPLIDIMESFEGKIDFVELIGGSTRIPYIQQILTEVYGAPLSKTLDGDECVGRGATLLCAFIAKAKTSSVRQLTLTERLYRNITLSTEDRSVSAVVFQRPEMDTTKDHKLVREVAVELKSLEGPLLLQYTSKGEQPFDILRIEFNPEQPDLKDMVIDKLLVTVAMTHDFRFEVQTVRAMCQPQAMSDDQANAPAPIKAVAHTVIYPRSLTLAQRDEIIAREAEFEKNDQIVLATQKALNDLESFVLNTRSKLEDGFKAYVDPAKLDDIKAKIREHCNWVDDDGYDADLETLTARHAEASKLTKDAEERYAEYSNVEAYVFDIIQRAVNLERHIRASNYLTPAEKEAFSARLSVMKPKYEELKAQQDAITENRHLPPTVFPRSVYDAAIGEITAVMTEYQARERHYIEEKRKREEAERKRLEEIRKKQEEERKKAEEIRKKVEEAAKAAEEKAKQEAAAAAAANGEAPSVDQEQQTGEEAPVAAAQDDATMSDEAAPTPTPAAVDAPVETSEMTDEPASVEQPATEQPTESPETTETTVEPKVQETDEMADEPKAAEQGQQ